MTTYDRHLLRRFLSVFAIMFISTYGLFVVFDGFSNIDEFQQVDDQSHTALSRMATFYTYQAADFFEKVGLILSVVSVMVVLALLQKSNELHPILAAGVPTYRLVRPFVIGTLIIVAALTINQELVIPSIAHRLQAGRHADNEKGQKVEPLTDYRTNINVFGDEIFVTKGVLEGARFHLPSPGIVHDAIELKAKRAVYHKQTGKRPAGWLLHSVSTEIEEEALTPAGRLEVVRRSDGDIFVVTDITPDRLTNRGKSQWLMSTSELVKSIRNPSVGIVSVKAQTLDVHSRLTRPISAVLMVFIVVPLVIRRESRSLIGNMARCSLSLAAVYGLTQVCNSLGGIMSPDLAVWMPVIFSGGLGAWLTGSVQT